MSSDDRLDFGDENYDEMRASVYFFIEKHGGMDIILLLLFDLLEHGNVERNLILDAGFRPWFLRMDGGFYRVCMENVEIDNGSVRDEILQRKV